MTHLYQNSHKPSVHLGTLMNLNPREIKEPGGKRAAREGNSSRWPEPQA